MRVIRRTVVRLVMVVMLGVMIRGRERRCGEREQQGEENELLHGYEHGTDRGRRHSEI